MQIVDARNPLLFRCEDLEVYVKEVNPNKVNAILVNKADLLSQKQRLVYPVLRIDLWKKPIHVKSFFYWGKQFCLFWLPRAVDFKVSCSQIPRRDSNPRPSGWESDVLTIRPRRPTSNLLLWSLKETSEGEQFCLDFTCKVQYVLLLHSSWC
jgi:hypothetical protein